MHLHHASSPPPTAASTTPHANSPHPPSSHHLPQYHQIPTKDSRCAAARAQSPRDRPCPPGPSAAGPRSRSSPPPAPARSPARRCRPRTPPPSHARTRCRPPTAAGPGIRRRRPLPRPARPAGPAPPRPGTSATLSPAATPPPGRWPATAPPAPRPAEPDPRPSRPTPAAHRPPATGDATSARSLPAGLPEPSARARQGRRPPCARLPLRSGAVCGATRRHRNAQSSSGQPPLVTSRPIRPTYEPAPVGPSR
jgi:hypothetical protein